MFDYTTMLMLFEEIPSLTRINFERAVMIHEIMTRRHSLPACVLVTSQIDRIIGQSHAKKNTAAMSKQKWFIKIGVFKYEITGNLPHVNYTVDFPKIKC